jgi:hypothetical protein
VQELGSARHPTLDGRLPGPREPAETQ